jgi:hypothetical protein
MPNKQGDAKWHLASNPRFSGDREQFDSEVLQNQALRIYRTQTTVIKLKNIRPTGLDPADHVIL